MSQLNLSLLNLRSISLDHSRIQEVLRCLEADRIPFRDQTMILALESHLEYQLKGKK